MLPSGTFFVIKDANANAYFNKVHWIKSFSPSCFYRDEKHAYRTIAKNSRAFEGKNVNIVEFSYLPTANSETGKLSATAFFNGAHRRVYCDTHGLYIRQSHVIWRPQRSTVAPRQPSSTRRSKWNTRWPITDANSGTWTHKGDTVMVDHYGHVLVEVEINGQLDKRYEQWYNHGTTRVRNRDRSIAKVSHDRCWIPAEDGA